MKKVVLFLVFVICSFSVSSQKNGNSSEKSAYIHAYSVNTISKYEDFITNYPQSEFVNEAKIRIGVRKKEIEIQKDNFSKLKSDLPFDEVISILSLGGIINKGRFGGMFVGIGLFPKIENNWYTGSLFLDGIYLKLKKNKLVDWKIAVEKMGSNIYSGSFVLPADTAAKGYWKMSATEIHVDYKKDGKTYYSTSSKLY